MSKMLRASGAMAAATMASRVLGMAREMVYAAFMGNTWVASAFTLAFMVPNLFRRLLGEGALTAAFIPMFKQKEVTEGEEKMWHTANAVISGLIAAAGIVTIVGIGVVSLLLASGLVKKPETLLMLQLLRVMFPYMLLVCLAAVLIGMTNARGHFFVPALGAAVLNVVMIGSVLWLAPKMGKTLETRIFGLAIGVVMAGIAQVCFQTPSLYQEGFRFHWVTPWQNAAVREVARKMLPGSIGVAAFQINVLITQGFSFWFDPTIASTFSYAVRLMELPQGLFGISLATYLLPALSGMAAEKKYDDFRGTLRTGLTHLAFANLLASAMAFALARPIVRLLFERGEFGPLATDRVSLTLMCLAPGLLMFSMNNILARAFYALGDVKTPMKISVACLSLNLLFSLALIKPFMEKGLGVANTTSAIINLLLLTYALRRKMARLELDAFIRTLWVLVPAAMGAGLLAALWSGWWEKSYGHFTLSAKIAAVFIPGTIASVAYWLVAWWAKVPAARELLTMIRRRASAG
jgi:putative peptidoglycan lipid II flippase